MGSLDPELKRLYEAIQGKLQTMRDHQQKKTKLVESRHQLGAQKNENELVRNELNHLEPGANVYKLIGPALVQQSEHDAKTIIEKRIEYIGGEISRIERQIEEADKAEESERNGIIDLQKKMNERHQSMQAQAAAQQQQQQ